MRKHTSSYQNKRSLVITKDEIYRDVTDAIRKNYTIDEKETWKRENDLLKWLVHVKDGDIYIYDGVPYIYREKEV